MSSHEPQFKVLGAGLPRTGTRSLQKALEILGFGPTLHMYEFFKDPQMSKDWIEAFELVHKGQQPNFGKLLRGYGSGVDAPLSEVYREILLQYPHVKVVLTHRPVDAWISSLHKTIFKVKSKVYGALIYLVPAMYWQRRLAIILFQRWDKYSSLEEVMTSRIAEAKKSVPEDQLLQFRVEEGWGPLCEFLNVPVPNVPFPDVNDTEALNHFIEANIRTGLVRWLLVGGSFAAAAAAWVARQRMRA